MVAIDRSVRKCGQRSAPNGGWGYCVLAGLSTCFILTADVISCFGLLYGDFMQNLGEGSKTMALMTSTYCFTSSIAGLFINILQAHFSLRAVGCCAALVYCVGGILCVFVTTVPQLLFVYGVMQGSGYGIMGLIGLTSFNRYFTNRRILMMGIANTLVGLGGIGMPLMIVQLIDAFGYRGCLAIMAALNGHVLVAMMVMHPVEWHTRRRTGIKRSEDDQRKGQQSTQTEPNETSLCLIPQSESPKAPGAVFSKLFSKIVDVDLLRDWRYLNISVGLTLTFFSDITFNTFQPMYLFHLGYSKSSAARIIAIGAACDVVSRFALSVFSTCVRISARTMFLIGTAATIAARLLFLNVTEFTAMAAVTGLMGFTRAWMFVPIALVLADYLPPERYTYGQALSIFIQGVLSLGLGPCVGWVHDYTGSYLVFFASLTGIMGVCVVSWTIEMVVMKWTTK